MALNLIVMDSFVGLQPSRAAIGVDGKGLECVRGGNAVGWGPPSFRDRGVQHRKRSGNDSENQVDHGPVHLLWKVP